MLGLQYFSFDAIWSPIFLFVMVAIGIGYFYLAGPWRLKHAPEAPAVTAGQKIWFVCGATLFYFAQGGPLDLLGHLLFSFHMTDMAISYLIVPPMLLLGIPEFMWRAAFGKPFWRRLNLLMHPILTLLLFNMLFSVYHMPQIHDYVMVHFAVHRFYYGLLLVTSVMMWWQIVCPVKDWNRLTDLRKMAYVFANGMLLSPACALIIFAGSPMYSTYNDPEAWAKAMGYCVAGDPSALLALFKGPSFFSLMSPLEDQQLGGIIMKLVQEIMYGAILAYVFFHWFKREHRDSDDVLPEHGTTGTAGAN
ncbi:cytochrome c oxidase assembly factor CtaG [Paenibacillus humicola]|uniref:cytochrome c oxidase assembly factor CtaG n=1 Tax=Paenibacillus humicola TaxID=3110540 RepID=UPI00237AFD9D|nr:cytochrome c oxidase assembly factor CtaG [Paenibacillus humicola]